MATFQSTPSAREGDPKNIVYAPVHNVSIHAFREGRRHGAVRHVGEGRHVSIHAFREGRRRESGLNRLECVRVSIHAFREGRRHEITKVLQNKNQFQSTPSAREGDLKTMRLNGSSSLFQSTPSAREGDLPVLSLPFAVFCVSIHAFREGRRPEYAFNEDIGRKRFQSTPSAREGDRFIIRFAIFRLVSIHAFREGRRQFEFANLNLSAGFQSTPSAREGDLVEEGAHQLSNGFQSTPSAREGDLRM